MVLNNLFLAKPGFQEILIILIIAGVFIFGAKKIPELARTLGKAKGEFEKGKIESEKELSDLKNKEAKSD
ncbi:MAG: twin-arginine translocase TatA/TatE family subunit [Nitrosopumilus sp.]|nr:twin-arginine translocase TatA/TatE family subunit [Nitrosopumilus sp.]